MAKMYPDSQTTRVVFASAAEEQIYQLCAKQLSKNWRVYHSCTLSAMEGDEGLKDNEMDFVFYHPKWGILVMEVKGGRISFENGVFSSVNRFGKNFVIKDPFQQALLFKSRLIRYLRRQSIKVPVSHGVCFPAAGEDEFAETVGHVPELIIGRNKMTDLENALITMIQKSQPAQYLEFSDVSQELDHILIGANFTTRLYLRDYIDGHELRVRDIESIHETLVTPIASTRRLAMEGEAGTGKTMLAVMLAKHFRDQGHSVLLLTSNALLNLLLANDLGQGIDIFTYTEIAASFGVNLLIPPQDFSGAREDWVQYVAPEKWQNALEQSGKRYQVVICDESQDVQPFWWDAIESLLDPKDEKTHFYVFFDASQGVFGSGGDNRFVASEVLPIAPPYFPLVHNYRTTREIAAFSRAFRTSQNVLQSHCGRLGYIPELITYKNVDDARRQLSALVQKLIEREGLEEGHITLLSARNPVAKESVLYQTKDVGGRALHRLSSGQKKTWKEARPPAGALGISTIAGFKGLETPVGVLLNVSEYNLPADHPIMASLIYVACTRAKHMLYVMVREDDSKRQAFERALSAIKASGTFVIDGGRGDFEFVGKVSHWNPDRLGWMTVDDPAFRQGSVMFFPHDVGLADINDLKIGTKVKFRPRVEGFVTIASELAVINE